MSENPPERDSRGDRDSDPIYSIPTQADGKESNN